MLVLLVAYFANRHFSSPTATTGGNVLAPVAWQDLDGVKYGEEDFSRHPATVLFFTSGRCPCSDVFSPAMAKLAQEYLPKGVRFFAVFSNGDETVADIRGFMNTRNLGFPAVRDEGGELSRQVRAVVTPSAVIFDAKRSVMYRGAIGDVPSNPAETAAVDCRQLTAALTTVLAGERPTLAPNNVALGCAIVTRATSGVPVIEANDNRRPAGRLENGVLTLRLVADLGLWQPEKKDGAAFPLQAFREEGQPLQCPGPLIRVPAGTELRVTVKNLLAGEPLEVHGLGAAPAPDAEPIRLGQGAEREFRWKAEHSGTFLYWAKTVPTELEFPHDRDCLLAGALIVDPPGTQPDPKERIFVLSEFIDLAPDSTPENLSVLRTVYGINGFTWPYTERLQYNLDERVRWRIINASTGSHPMHLHGFYFDVLARSDGTRSISYPEGAREKAVTELLRPATTVDIEWTPQEVGRWLFHCHVAAHFSPSSRLRPPGAGPRAENEHTRHALEEMSGLVLGIEVNPGASPRPKAAKAPAREIALHIREHPKTFGNLSAYSLTPMENVQAAPPAEFSVPAPPLVLTRGQRTQIKVVNHLQQPTAIHWHGIELESLSDGVVGWGGHATSVTPSIEPGGFFVAEMTPPRAGTFIYHSHFDDVTQLRRGLFGPLIVLEPGESFDPARERIFIISSGPGRGEPLRLNGSPTPGSMELKKGETYRFRLINITANTSRIAVRFSAGEQLLRWRAIAKDGANLPPTLARLQPAHQNVTVGETRDFEFTAERTGEFSLSLINQRDVALVAMPVFVQ